MFILVVLVIKPFEKSIINQTHNKKQQERQESAPQQISVAQHITCQKTTKPLAPLRQVAVPGLGR